MDVEHLYYENLRLRRRIMKLELELQEERLRSSQNVDLLIKGETMRQRLMLDAILGKFPPT